MGALLGRCTLRAALSLEALLAVTAAVARDLRADFLPYLPRVVATLTALVDEGAPLPWAGSWMETPSRRTCAAAERTHS